MNIVIFGAGDFGSYLASTLSKEEHNVLVIDRDKDKLANLAQLTDVAVRVGSGADWQLLDEILEISPDLFISLTNHDETNLVACSLAKQLGFPSTIARVHDSRFLNRTRLDFGRVFDVDYFICPELIAANEILKVVLSEKSLMVESFAHGAVLLKTMKIPSSWERVSTELSSLNLPEGVVVGLIRRYPDKEKDKDVLIFPHGKDVLLPGDEVTFIGEARAIDELQRFFGIKHDEIKSVVIVGGSNTAMHLARLLGKRGVKVRIIEKDRERATYLADQLPGITVILHDALDINFLNSEKIGLSDLLVACTKHDDTNLMATMLGRQVGCKRVLMILSQQSNHIVLDELGIQNVVSPVVAATNRILAKALTGTVNTLVSLYDNRAEVVEVNVSNDSGLVGIPLSDLGPLLPRDFLIAVIQNRGRVMIANGARIISPGDTVILITTPNHIAGLEKIF